MIKGVTHAHLDRSNLVSFSTVSDVLVGRFLAASYSKTALMILKVHLEEISPIVNPDRTEKKQPCHGPPETKHADTTNLVFITSSSFSMQYT